MKLLHICLAAASALLSSAGAVALATPAQKSEPKEAPAAKEVRTKPLHLSKRPAGLLRIGAMPLPGKNKWVCDADFQLPSNDEPLECGQLLKTVASDSPMKAGPEVNIPTTLPTFRYMPLYDSKWSSGYDFSLWKYDPNESSTTRLAQGDRFYGADFTVTTNDAIYTSVPLENDATFRFKTSVFDYSELDKTYNTSKIQALSSTFDRTTGTIYVCVLNAEATGFYLTTFDPETGTTGEVMADYGTEGMAAMGVTRSGRLVGVTRTGKLCTIDKTTGEKTVLNAFSGINASYNVSGCCDPLRENIFYYAYFSTSTAMLVAFDLETRGGKAIATFPRLIEMTGLTIDELPFDVNAPGKPSDLTASFTDDALTGTISFTMPSTLYDGSTPEAGTGTNWEIMANDQPLTSGSALYGENVTTSVTLPARGEYTITVGCSNSAGAGETISTSGYYGYDDMIPVSNPALAIDGRKFTVTWTGLQPVHGGYWNPALTKYDIIRYPDEVTMAEGLTTTSWTWTAPESLPDGAYSFGIRAWQFNPDSGKLEALPEVKTTPKMLGDYKPPFSFSLVENAQEAVASFSKEDTNADGYSWVFTTGGAMIQYNQDDPTVAMDDWLFSMPVKLQAGLIYSLDITVSNMGGYDERIGVSAGRKTNSKDMTVNVIPAFEFDGLTTRKGSFCVPTDGYWYIGFHGCSDADKYALYLKSFSITATGTVKAPGAVTELTGHAIYTGSKQDIELLFTAPAVTAEGGTLSSIERIEISRDGEMIKTFASPAPGEALSFTDENLTGSAKHTYCVVAYNEEGPGLQTEINIFAGYDLPTPIDKIHWDFGDLDDNSMRFYWNPVTHDLSGRRIDKTIWYQPMIIFPNTAQRTAGNGLYATPGFTYNEIDKYNAQLDPNYNQEENAPFFCRVYASTYYYDGAGMFQGNNYMAPHVTFTSYFPVGKAQPLPFVESLADGDTSNPLAVTGNDTWGTFVILTSSTTPSAQPWDGDGGMLAFKPSYLDDEATIWTARMDLTEAVTPEMSVMYYNVPGSLDEIDLVARIDDAKETVLLHTAAGAGEIAGWTPLKADLSAYAGKKVQLGIKCTCKSGNSYVLLDAWKIEDNVADNLRAAPLQAPSSVKAGTSFTVSAPVLNCGHNDIDSYTATLCVNGKELETKEFRTIARKETQIAEFTVDASVTHLDGIDVAVTFHADADANAADDSSGTEHIRVRMPSYPTVSDLNADNEADNITLVWSRPLGIGEATELVEDDLEGLTPFSIGVEDSELGEEDSLGGWSVIDADGQPVCQIGNAGFPNNRLQGGDSSPKAWMVFNLPQSGVAPNYATLLQPHSGEQCFICPAAVPADDNTGNDDWLISPLLSGQAQTVTFFARSMSTAYGQERFEVLYSNEGTEMSEFTKLSEYTVDDNWNQISADLPEGAKHFAIRCTSYDAWALLADDFTYEAAGDASLELTGYRIYHNLEPLADLDPRQEEFLHAEAGEDDLHQYHVSALYNAGESALSNKAEVDLRSGVENLTSSKCSVTAGKGYIRIDMPAGTRVRIHSAAGIEVWSGTTQAEPLIIPLEAGIYTVTWAQRTVKAHVR